MGNNNANDAEERYVFKNSYTLDDLRHGVIPPGALYSTIHDLGREHVVEAIPDIERFLTHEDPQLRYVALEVLTLHFKLQQHWETARRFLEQDPNDDCRMMGASSLAVLRRNTSDRRTLEILATAVRNEHDNEVVRAGAYAALLGIIKFDPREDMAWSSGRKTVPADVDWPLVNSYLPGGNVRPGTLGG